MREIIKKFLWLIGMICKGTAFTVLFLLKLILEVLKLALLVFSLVARVFLIFVRAGVPE
ncbi:hypothetical protein [Anaerobium acetethylicum]|uniref:Uncharacterized protein n=1 Tax=Anaerobium acetethylicum TaxID=1619234 RepID=A0A1D3TUL6_9FIRM|nr:hypothetical protein [Anaerobium acetethylicum]SCP97739.1 hypothetical protein SAMN05421730_101344 [Anaerobium acetethylicum]